jgi:acyl carrier protein
MDKLTKKIFKKIFGNKINININSDINSIYKWDSLNHIRLISEIEKITKIKLNINQVIQLTSVKKIDNLLKKNGSKI